MLPPGLGRAQVPILSPRLWIAGSNPAIGPRIDGPKPSSTAHALVTDRPRRAFGDHDRLLPECALVVSHGGLGTVLRALAHGVPLLILPLGRDQAFNASRVEALGAGIALPLDASPQRIQAALGTLRSDASFGAAAVKAGGRIAAGRPDHFAGEALEALRR
jgi:UDP:flavonoid glycosyltransferase YjiC (YdhE family)